MVMFDWLEERVREKDEWRFATMEYGGQCVTMAGINWMLILSAENWDMDNLVSMAISQIHTWTSIIIIIIIFRHSYNK